MTDGAADAERSVEPAHRVPTTILLALAAVGTALIAMFGEDDSFTALTAVSALAGLVPWALLAGGVRIPTWLFAVLGLAAAAPIVLIDHTIGGLFPVMIVIVEVARSAPALAARRRHRRRSPSATPSPSPSMRAHRTSPGSST